VGRARDRGRLPAPECVNGVALPRPKIARNERKASTRPENRPGRVLARGTMPGGAYPSPPRSFDAPRSKA
jgi:hypothetical protein